jgi:hypothetical protein
MLPALFLNWQAMVLVSCMDVQYDLPMDTLLSTQWIAQCADRLHQRWRTVEPAQLEDLAVDLWKDVQLRAMPPEEAAAVWLSPVKVQEDTSPENIAAN